VPYDEDVYKTLGHLLHRNVLSYHLFDGDDDDDDNNNNNYSNKNPETCLELYMSSGGFYSAKNLLTLRMKAEYNPNRSKYIVSLSLL